MDAKPQVAGRKTETLLQCIWAQYTISLVISMKNLRPFSSESVKVQVQTRLFIVELSWLSWIIYIYPICLLGSQGHLFLQLKGT